MSNIVIELLDERTIGRNFQVAALGAIRDSLPGNVVSKIRNGIVDGKLLLSANDLQYVLNTLATYLNSICGAKTAFPTFYRAGKGDVKILSSAGIPVSSSKDLCKALVGSVQNIVSNPTRTVDVPMLLRTYVFSKYRTSLDEVRSIETSATSLYIAMGGAVISMIDSFEVRGARKGTKVKKQKRKKEEEVEERREQYLIPDGSVTSFDEASKVYGLVYASNQYRLGQFIRSILDNLENISFEVAVLVGFMSYVYFITRFIKQLPSIGPYYGSFEVFRIVSIRPEWRPQVMWERPLTISAHLETLEERCAIDILRLIRNLASSTENVRNQVEAYDDVVSQCIHELYGYMETGSLDLLTSCASRALRVLDTLQSKNICDKYKDVCRNMEIMLTQLSSLVA